MSVAEHHSVLAPFQLVAGKRGARIVDVCLTRDSEEIDLEVGPAWGEVGQMERMALPLLQCCSAIGLWQACRRNKLVPGHLGTIALVPPSGCLCRTLSASSAAGPK